MTNNRINNKNAVKTTTNSATNIDSDAHLEAELKSSNSITDAASQIGESIINSASKTTQEVMENVGGLGVLLQDFVEMTSKQAHQLLECATEQTGQTLEIISENPLLKFISKFWGTKWLVSILGEVDREKIQAKVKEIKLKYPQEKPSQIAHRLMINQAWEAGKVGMVTNIIPPIALALFGLELAATTKLQSEMVYQIAGAYGLDLNEPTRRGEVLAIFGLSMGGNAIKTGFSFVEIIPGVGPVVGASTNAMILYALGFTACRFYETKLNGTNNIEKLETFQKITEDYWESANTQFVVMDQILAHMILASYPEKSWSDILPALETVSPASVEAISAHLENPQPLELLLEKLSPELAMSVLANCYRIAKLDSIITPPEQIILDAIAEKFEIDLNSLEIDETGLQSSGNSNKN